MDILGIGMPELIFIVLIALIVLGPKDMQKAGKTIGTWMRKVVMSPEWRAVKDTSRKISTLPNQWMREANEDLQQFQKEVSDAVPPSDLLGTWGGGEIRPKNPPVTPADDEPAPVKKTSKNTIAPPANDPPALETDDA